MQLSDEVNGLYQNIKEARAQLSKLKQEASAFSNDPYNLGNQNMREYMKNAVYSLNKNDVNVDKKISEYKAKLPSIHKQDRNQLDTSLVGYRKLKKPVKKSISKRPSEQTTKVQDSFSFSIQNRPMKMHSNYQKYTKPQYTQIQAADQLTIPIQFQKIKEQIDLISNHGTNQKFHSKNRIQFSSQRKKLKYVDLNSSAIIKQSNDLLKPPNQMEYSDIVDKYSKHEFMIINGKIANQGPQYASYARIYQSIFKKIKQEIKRLQDLLLDKKINFARFDGKKLAYLCLKDEVKKSQLIDCIIDQNSKIKQILLPSSKYTGKKGKQVAAVKIQSFLKMCTTRQKYLLLKKKSIVIQRFFRKNLLRLQLQKKINERNQKILQRFEKRQQALEQNWKTIKKQKRIQIHLNSMQVDEQKRLSIQNFSQRENIQLSRIFRLQDQNIILIYISSSQLPSELINYYYKMLQLAGVQKYEDRLLFFSPSDAQKFPQHFSVSRLLYYSTKTLKQLKIITQDLPTLLYPGFPSNQLIKICDFVNCYLFSGSPQKIKPFTTRSQTLTFLKNLSIPCLPSAMQMYDYGEFLNTFSVLIMKNPEIKTWVLKIDDEFGGRGIAYFQVFKSNFVRSLLNKIEYNKTNDQFFTTEIGDIISQPQNQQITIKIRDYLKQNLPEKLIIATPTVYRSYSQYMGRFIKKGGVIQAKPAHEKQKLYYPSISFCVDPLGQFQIFASYDKIIGSAYRSYACSFPQKSINIKEGTNVIRQICQSFKIRKIFGNFTIDFIVSNADDLFQNQRSSDKSIKNKQKSMKFWVIGLDPFINNYTSSFYMFHALMNGSYFPEKNLYLVEKEDQKLETFSVDTMSSEANLNKQARLVQRTYIFIPHFFNQNMFRVKIKQFFKQARIQRFNFDIGNKEGICIMLLDALTSGTMSMMAVSRSDYETVNLLKNVLDFIVKLSDIKNVTYGKTDCEPSTDRILIKDMMNLFLTMIRKDQRSNGKAKAIKKFENNQNLNFIF